MSSQQWKNDNTVRYNLLILKKSGIPDALKEASEKAEKKPTTYIQIALREKLIRDGYLIAESQNSEE